MMIRLSVIQLIEKGYKSGPKIGNALKVAFEAQLDGNMNFDELLSIAVKTLDN